MPPADADRGLVLIAVARKFAGRRDAVRIPDAPIARAGPPCSTSPRARTGAVPSLANRGARARGQANLGQSELANRPCAHAADDNTSLCYMKGVSRFLRDARRQQAPFDAYHERDAALANNAPTLCYLRRSSVGAGNSAFFGFFHVIEDHRGKMQKSAQAH